jgi:tRNA pseudouridine55 synthase
MTKSNSNNVSEQPALMLLLDKPKDYSSARVVNIVKKFLDVNKAGHSGTLDPKATGLMIVCTGKLTKSLNELLGCDKEYEGVMVLGEKTRSFDSETEIYEKNSIEHISSEKIVETVKNFIGEIDQLPPMYSAVKHKGKPLYKFARKGKELERSTRKIIIKEFEIKSVNLPEVEFRVVCSKGTYIRALVSDFGDDLKAGAYLKELRRVKIGAYDVKDSMTVEDFITMHQN